jgi:hypothetical protein
MYEATITATMTKAIPRGIQNIHQFSPFDAAAVGGMAVAAVRPDGTLFG